MWVERLARYSISCLFRLGFSMSDLRAFARRKHIKHTPRILRYELGYLQKTWPSFSPPTLVDKLKPLFEELRRQNQIDTEISQGDFSTDEARHRRLISNVAVSNASDATVSVTKRFWDALKFSEFVDEKSAEADRARKEITEIINDMTRLSFPNDREHDQADPRERSKRRIQVQKARQLGKKVARFTSLLGYGGLPIIGLIVKPTTLQEWTRLCLHMVVEALARCPNSESFNMADLCQNEVVSLMGRKAFNRFEGDWDAELEEVGRAEPHVPLWVNSDDGVEDENEEMGE